MLLVLLAGLAFTGELHDAGGAAVEGAGDLDGVLEVVDHRLEVRTHDAADVRRSDVEQHGRLGVVAELDLEDARTPLVHDSVFRRDDEGGELLVIVDRPLVSQDVGAQHEGSVFGRRLERPTSLGCLEGNQDDGAEHDRCRDVDEPDRVDRADVDDEQGDGRHEGVQIPEPLVLAELLEFVGVELRDELERVSGDFGGGEVRRHVTLLSLEPRRAAGDERLEVHESMYIISHLCIFINSLRGCDKIRGMFDSILPTLKDAQKFVIIQAENPDGDSLGSSLALEELLSEAGKDVKLYCAIDIPKYMHYIQGWDRVEKDWPTDREVAILVDTSAETLIQQALKTPGVRHFLETHPVIVIDHHDTEGDLPFETLSVVDSNAVATSEVLFHLAKAADWNITPSAAESMFISIQADSLGLTTPSTTANSYQVAADLVALGADPSEIENRRREYMKKPADILKYKGELIERIEYLLDGKLAIIHIPWDEIQTYSDRYNPSVLVLEEMRMVEGVEVAVALKTYPDGKLTGKIRVNAPIAEVVAGYFGGGGHAYAAGFKVFENYDTIISELITATDKAITDYESSIS